MPARAGCEGTKRQVAQRPADAARTRPAEHRLPVLVLGEDEGPRVRPARSRCWPSAPASPGRQLTFQEGVLEPNQDWKRLDVVFNSLDQKEANLYVGIWGEGPGTSLGGRPCNSRSCRSSTSCWPRAAHSVKSADGQTTYDERRDYEPVVDPKLGARSPGRANTNSTIRRARSASARARGSRPATGCCVSWYHPVITHGSQVMCCLSEPKLEEILLRPGPAGQRPVPPPDVLHVARRDPRGQLVRACQDRKLTPGQILADNVRRCTKILKSVNPRARIVVWSDMFDPHHNAVDTYYLVNGSLKGSWEGLSRDVIIANWNGGKARESLAFFAGRGHRQLIAGYYDVDDLSNFQPGTRPRDVQGVVGFMYTTWEPKYRLLEHMARQCAARRNPELPFAIRGGRGSAEPPKLLGAGLPTPPGPRPKVATFSRPEEMTSLSGTGWKSSWYCYFMDVDPVGYNVQLPDMPDLRGTVRRDRARVYQGVPRHDVLRNNCR